ncbi:OmpA family protein [Rudanella lutea]|uniref:OmpA family protein n=1 Tax=Rudanella lutea TaxID=451374 RepID=UPI000366FE17|nr:OmpA family protein [Rudanella lutea]
MITLDGPVRNVVKQQFAHWQQDKVSFGNEGGGGGYDNFFSPRNHVYTFEPELDSWFDVQAESNGVPVKICVVDPTGKVTSQHYSSEDGAPFLVQKATQKGVYKIWVATRETNGRGTYKLDVVGTFKQNPTRVETTQQTINGQFVASQKRHEYRIPARLGNVEIIYRSTNTPASFTLYDQFNQPIESFFRQGYESYNQLLDRSFAVKQEGTLKLVVETKEATVGDYELMVWGHAGPIVNANQRAATPAPAPATTAPASTGKAAQILADVLLSGRIRLPRSASSFRGVKVVYEDVDTGQKLGEALPDDKGNYSIMVPPGRKYAITATTEDGAISSSQYVNLARKTQPNERIVLDEIAIISALDVGSAITLNNIFFETGKDRLLPASYTELSRVAKFMKANPSVKVEISGHTDMQGSATLNQKLSQDRAISVSYYLQGNGIGAGQIKAIGLGSSKPVAPNTTPAGREKNRRVEFKIVGKS